MAATWKITVRAGSKVEHERHDTLEAALAAVRARVEDLRPRAGRETAQVFRREIAPVAQVAARLELRGPGGPLRARRGGIDVRGDGSVEAWAGRLGKRVLEGRDVVDALARELR
jgi:hypothetical protein